jgi:hypothetical protein
MRVVLLAALVALSSGCMFGGEPCKIDPKPWKTCSYALAGVSATTTFSNASWDREAAARALVALGFAVASSSSNVAATVGNAAGERLYVTARTDGAIEWVSEFSPQGDEEGLGYTQEQAQAVGQKIENASRERADALLAGFERETTWTRDAPLAWRSQLMVV